MLDFVFFVIFILKIGISSDILEEPIPNTGMNFSTVETAKGPVRLGSFTFRQKLTHFNDSDHRTFDQNYWVVATYYRKGGPAFLFINGEHTVDENRAYGFHNTSLAYAQNLGAICFSLEHRFYSKTWPVNYSLADYLNREQALADLRYFVKGVTKDFYLPKDIKWVSFGCSYSGNLSALMRWKFSDVIFASVASSASLLSILDYSEYDQIVEESLKSYDSKCVESITLAFVQISNLGNSAHDIKNIVQLFNLRGDRYNDISIIKTYILSSMVKVIGDTVQNTDVGLVSIPSLCKIMIEYNGTKLEALAEVRRLHMKYKNSYENIPSVKSQEGENPVQDEYTLPCITGDPSKAWLFQRCSDLGFFTSYTNVTYLVPVKHLLLSIEMQIELLCVQFFGPKFNIEYVTQRINQMNSLYGGLDFNVSNTIFIHGSLDPWYKLGLYNKSNNSLYESIFIQGTSHCGDVYPPSDRDIPELKNARSKVLATLKKWLDN